MKKLMCMFLLCAASCSTLTMPYTTEYPIGDWKMDWLSDGPWASKVLSVSNPLPYPIYAIVRCETNYEVMSKQVFHLASKDEQRMTLQVMNRDIPFNCCVVENWGRE